MNSRLVNNYIMSTVLSGAIDGNFHTRGKVLIVKSKMEDDSESEKQRIRSGKKVILSFIKRE